MRADLSQAVAANSMLAAGCDGSVALEMGTFDARVRLFTGRLELATAPRRRTLLASLAKVRTYGNTDILDALLAAIELLGTSKAPKKWVGIVTDGRQTQGIPAALLADIPAAAAVEARARAAGEALARRAKAQGVRILAVGLGPGADHRLLESLAAGTGGVYLPARRADELLPVYVEWLRTVGGYYVTRQSERVKFFAGDSDLKILAALPSAHLEALERDGKAVDLGADGFESWEDPRLRLHVLQAGRPPAGSYRVRFLPARGSEDILFVLKHSPQRWDVRIDHHPDDLLQPMRVAVRCDPPPPPGQRWEVGYTVGDTQGTKKPEGPFPLPERRDGTFGGDLYLDREAEVQLPGTYNVRVRIRDPLSGWESEHTQTVRFEDGPPRVKAEVLLTGGGAVTARWRGADIDLGTLPPATEQAMKLRLRSTAAAKGFAVEVATTSQAGGLKLTTPHRVTINGPAQSVNFSLRTPAPFLKDPAGADLRLSFATPRPAGATLNGSPAPVSFRFKARPTTADLRPVVRSPGEGVRLKGGQRIAWEWELRLQDDPLPEGELEAELVWAPPADAAPRLALGSGGTSTTLRLPLRKLMSIPVSLDAPRNTTPGSYRARVDLRVVADRPVSLNGKPEMELPLTFRIERPTPPTVHIKLLDRHGVPLPGNTLRHRVLSPVAPRKEVLRLQLVGKEALKDAEIRLLREEVGSVCCQMKRLRPERPGGVDQLLVTLAVPAQAAPGVRAFVFAIDPGPTVRLAPDSQRFTVELEVPEATLSLGPSPGGQTTIPYRMGYLEWLRLHLLRGKLAWRGRLAVLATPVGLDEQVGFDLEIARPGPPGARVSLARDCGPAPASRHYKVSLEGDTSETGTFPVTARVRSPYRHLRVEGANGTGVTVGQVVLSEPPKWPVLLAWLAGVGLLVLDQFRRRRVPGQLLVRDPEAAVLGAAARRTPLGRKRHRVRLGAQGVEIRRRWRTVYVRWVKGRADEDAVVLECPDGHRRSLKLGGAWEPLHNQDTMRAGLAEAEYVAPLPRHCRLAASACQHLAALFDPATAGTGGAP